MATDALDPPQTADVVDEAKRLLARLTPDEKSRVLRWFVEDRNGPRPSITHTPGVCGGDACVGSTRIMVWLLESYRRSGVSLDDLLENYPGLRPEDITNAWAYAAEHPEEIDRNIREDAELDEELDNELDKEKR